MAAVLAPLLALGGLALYLGLSTRWALNRRTPVEFMAISAAGAVLGVVAALRDPGLATGLAAVAAIGLCGFAFWYIWSYSMYGRREERPAVGERLPEFALADSQGGVFRLAEARGRPLLLLFYRGDW